MTGRSYKERGLAGKVWKKHGKKQRSLNHEVLYEEFCSEFLFACSMGTLKCKCQASVEMSFQL